MEREEMLSSIFTQFDQCAQQFCDATQGVFCDISSEYKGARKPQNLKRRTARIYYRSFVVEFSYTAHGIMGTVNSILSCNVSLDKGEDAMLIPLPLALDYCDMDTLQPLCIPLITNPDAMEQAYACIGSVLEKMLPVLADVSCDSGRLEAFQTAFCNELKFLFAIEELAPVAGEVSRSLADFFLLRFSDGAFMSALRGNHGKAIKQLKKIKKLTGYEQRMLRLWSLREALEPTAPAAVLRNAKTFNGYGTSKAEVKELLSAMAAWFVLCPVFSAVYLLVYHLLVLVEDWGAVYLMGPSYNYPFCVCGGFITAIAASYFCRFSFYKLLFKKDYAQYRELEYIQNLEGANKLMKGFLAVIAAGCILLCVLLANWNLRFLPDGFKDNSKFLSLRGEFHSYDEIDHVFYKPDRVNDFGDTLDFPSYVLVMKDGTQIDLYEHGEIEDYEDVLLPILAEKGVKIEAHP